MPSMASAVQEHVYSVCHIASSQDDHIVSSLNGQVPSSLG